MKPLTRAGVLLLLTAPTILAGPVENAMVAITRLGEAPNYSWTATITDDARTYEIDGKTVRGGYTQVRMPVVNRIRRQLGRDVGDPQTDAIFRGNVDCVLLTEHGWLRPDELRESRNSRDVAPSPHGDGSTTLRVPTNGLPWPPRSDPKKPQPYSNLQLAISHPHEELSVILSSHESFEVAGNTVSGTLTIVGAQLLLVREGQSEIIPIRANGTYKLWLRDGSVARYQLKLDGVLSVQTPRGRAHVTVQQSALTEIRNVGRTRFDVPADVKIKLPPGQ